VKDGFLKVAAATPKIRVADCEYNAGAIIGLMDRAQSMGAKLLCLPELCVTGYTCGDLFLQRELLDGAAAALKRIAKASGDMLTVVGLPVEHAGKLYACAAAVQGGRVLGIVPKTCLPNYAEFYEQRHFCEAPEKNGTVTVGGSEVPFGRRLLFCCRQMPEFVLGIEICEDLWSYLPPSCALAAAGATVIANPSASDEIVGKADYRRGLVGSQSARLFCGYVYADAGEGESSTDLVFAAHNIIAENGVILAENRFSSDITVSELDLGRCEFERRRNTSFPPQADDGFERIMFNISECETVLTRHISARPFVPDNGLQRAERCEEILTIQALGLKKRLEHTHAKSAVIGLSGGLDSTLAALVAARAMDMLGRGRRDLVCVTMPCFGTTQRTKGNAEILAEKLGATLRVVDIADAVKQHFADIGHDESDRSVVYENSQARERTQVLMDIANAEGGLVIGTGDLSELALGWATYNGDHMSMYAVNASIPKTLVRWLVGYAAEKTDDDGLRGVLLDILDTPVSPELLPAENGEIAQKTEDLVGPYELHDFFLYYGVRWAFRPRKVYRLACYALGDRYDRGTILKWLRVFYRRFFAQQFKRSCLPDGPKVGTVAVSPRGDLRMPSDACAELWLNEIDGLAD
jgi:NAD+ synthase (glutamine-hydrolysing)